MAYTVLARRYRSERFEELIGQEAVATTLANAIKSGRIAHAFLFTGVRGVGKTSAARILAKSLNCLNSDGPTVKPCLKCSSCTAIHSGEDIDVIEIDGASNNSVDSIRELRENAIYRPSRSRFKIYIIDEVHMLSSSAFNALLKTLEEPPGHVKFIFATTEPQKIPATILSRCQRYDFRTIPQEEIAGHLEKILEAEEIKAEPEAVAHVARLAAGSMRDGLSILDQLLSVGQKKLTIKQVEQTLGMPHFRQVHELVVAIGGKDVAGAVRGLNELLGLGHSLEQIIAALIEHCRNLLLLLACGGDTKLVVWTGDNRQKLIEQSSALDMPTVVFFISVLEELSRSVRFSSSAKALCEAGLVRLAGRENFISAGAMMDLLESGTSGVAGPSSSSKSRNSLPPAGQTKRSETSKAGGTRSVNSGKATQSMSAKIAADEPLNLEVVQKIWSEFLNDLETNGSTNLAGLLKMVRPTQVNGNSVTVSIQPQYRNLLGLLNDPGRKSAIREKLSQALAREIQLEIAGPDPSESENVPLAKASGASLSKEDVEASRGNPLVSKTLELFGGMIINVSDLGSSERA